MTNLGRLVVGLVLAGCGKSEAPPYAVRYDLFYGADLTQHVSARWGSAVATGSPAVGARPIVLEHRFATRDEAVGFQQPVDIMLGATGIFSETPLFAACDFVGDAGVDPSVVRVVRFSRAIDSNTATVLKLSRSSQPALSCYTSPTIVSETQPLARDRLEVLFRLTLPTEAYGFMLDGRELLPVALGREDQDTRVWILLRAAASIGSHDVGQLAVSSAAVTGAPFPVTTADCQDSLDSGRLVQKVQTLNWASGVLSVDPFAGLTCCYDNGLCSVSIP